MQFKEAQARIKARVWKALAQSKIDLSALPEESADALVDIVTEAALLEMDVQLGETVAENERPFLSKQASPQLDEDDPDSEYVLWEGRPFLSLTKHYRITDERVRIEIGLLSKRRIDIELIKIQDINQSQRIAERMINVGDIIINSHDPSNPRVKLENIADVQRVHEILRRAMLDMREKMNFSYREEM